MVVTGPIAHVNAREDIDPVAPTIRFSDRMSFVHGSKTFELTYLGQATVSDLVAVVVRPDDGALVVDAVGSRRLFYRDFPGTNADHWIERIKRVYSLDFEVMIGGHGPSAGGRASPKRLPVSNNSARRCLRA